MAMEKKDGDCEITIKGIDHDKLEKVLDAVADDGYLTLDQISKKPDTAVIGIYTRMATMKEPQPQCLGCNMRKTNMCHDCKSFTLTVVNSCEIKSVLKIILENYREKESIDSIRIYQEVNWFSIEALREELKDYEIPAEDVEDLMDDYNAFLNGRAKNSSDCIHMAEKEEN